MSPIPSIRPALARAARRFGAAALLALALPSTAMEPGSTAPPPHPLTFAARVWGLAKYHHPGVTACTTLDWDQLLLDRVAALEAAPAASARHAILAATPEAAGATGRTAPTAQTPRWIAASEMSAELRERLAWLATQRPASQCYVGPAAGTRQAAFDRDKGHETTTPDRAHRALAAFRYWNAIEYWFPYKDDIGRDWSSVLDQHLPRILDADALPDYAMSMRALTAA